MDKIARYASAQSVQIGKKRTATEAGFSETTQGITPQATIGEPNHWHHFYHHVEPDCSCGGVRYKMKSKKKHSVKKGLELKDLKRCHYERDGECDYCSSARGKFGWDPCFGTHAWDPPLGPTLAGTHAWDP